MSLSGNMVFIFGAKPTSLIVLYNFCHVLFFRQITGASQYLTKNALHKDRQIPTVNNIATRHYKKFQSLFKPNLPNFPYVINYHSYQSTKKTKENGLETFLST